MYCVLYFFFVIGTKILGNDHACTYRSTLAKCNQKADQRCAGAYCGQCITANIISYNNRICSVIKLLQKIPKDQRYRKEKNLPGNASLGHQLIFICFYTHYNFLPQNIIGFAARKDNIYFMLRIC